MPRSFLVKKCCPMEDDVSESSHMIDVNPSPRVAVVEEEEEEERGGDWKSSLPAEKWNHPVPTDDRQRLPVISPRQNVYRYENVSRPSPEADNEIPIVIPTELSPDTCSAKTSRHPYTEQPVHIPRWYLQSNNEEFWSSRFPFYVKPRAHEENGLVPIEKGLVHNIKGLEPRRNGCWNEKCTSEDCGGISNSRYHADNLVPRLPPNDNLVPRLPPNDNLVPRLPPNDNLVPRLPPNNNIVPRLPPNDNLVPRLPPNDNLVPRLPPLLQHCEKVENMKENIVVVQPSDLTTTINTAMASKQQQLPPQQQYKQQEQHYEQQQHHQQQQQQQRHFSCKYCSKDYMSLGALKMHIRTHTLPCKCRTCGKCFSRPWLLQGHIRTHTGERPFKCPHCGRAFADRSNLRAHVQTHSEVKKYVCGRCGKNFSRMSMLVKHEQTPSSLCFRGGRGTVQT